MGGTAELIRQPGPTAECPAASTLRDTYYRPLVRLAALLTGDADVAELVARDALAGLRPGSLLGPEANADVLRRLQRRVLVRCRRSRIPATAPAGIRPARRGARSPVPADAGDSAGSAQPSAADFACLPVVRALQELPPRGREAIVLTYYLDLTEEQAALVAGVAPTALRRFLIEAMRALQDRFPGS
jgi:DNA-directed RNA polymerase specialized sigma24 family protein